MGRPGAPPVNTETNKKFVEEQLNNAPKDASITHSESGGIRVDWGGPDSSSSAYVDNPELLKEVWNEKYPDNKIGTTQANSLTDGSELNVEHIRAKISDAPKDSSIKYSEHGDVRVDWGGPDSSSSAYVDNPELLKQVWNEEHPDNKIGTT